jgi:hypothetical protein
MSSSARYEMLWMVAWLLGSLYKVPRRPILQGAALIIRCCLWRNKFSPETIWWQHTSSIMVTGRNISPVKTWNLTQLKCTVDQWNHWCEHYVKSRVCQWVPKQMHMARKGYRKIVYEASTVLLDREWLLKGQWLCSGIFLHLRKWDIVTLKAYNAVSFCL